MKIAKSLIAAALVVAPLSASADGFTFTDDRCLPAVNEAICIANASDVSVKELIGNKVDFATFVSLNANALPEDVTELSIIPAMTVYIADLKS